MRDSTHAVISTILTIWTVIAEATAKPSHSTEVIALQDRIEQLEGQIAELKNRI